MEKDNGPLAGLPFEVAKERYPRAEFINPFQPNASARALAHGLEDFRRGATLNVAAEASREANFHSARPGWGFATPLLSVGVAGGGRLSQSPGQ